MAPNSRGSVPRTTIKKVAKAWIDQRDLANYIIVLRQARKVWFVTFIYQNHLRPIIDQQPEIGLEVCHPSGQIKQQPDPGWLGLELMAVMTASSTWLRL